MDYNFPKCLHDNTFCDFWHQKLSNGKKFVQDRNGNPNSIEQTPFSKLIQTHNLYILMAFYLVLSRGVCPRPTRPGWSAWKFHCSWANGSGSERWIMLKRNGVPESGKGSTQAAGNPGNLYCCPSAYPSHIRSPHCRHLRSDVIPASFETVDQYFISHQSMLLSSCYILMTRCYFIWVLSSSSNSIVATMQNCALLCWHIDNLVFIRAIELISI
jgi:hypothetical protein